MKKIHAAPLFLTIALMLSGCSGAPGASGSPSNGSGEANVTQDMSDGHAGTDNISEVTTVPENMNGNVTFFYNEQAYSLPMRLEEMLPVVAELDVSAAYDCKVRSSDGRLSSTNYLKNLDFSSEEFYYEPGERVTYFFEVQARFSPEITLFLVNDTDAAVSVSEMLITDLLVMHPSNTENFRLPGNFALYNNHTNPDAESVGEIIDVWGEPYGSFEWTQSLGAKNYIVEYVIENDDGTFTGTLLESSDENGRLKNFYMFYHGGGWYQEDKGK